MQRSLSVVLLIVLGFGCLSFRKALPDLSSPKAVVRSFSNAVKDSDIGAMAICVKNGIEIPELKNFWLKTDEAKDFFVTQILAETEGNTGKVAIEYRFRSENTTYSQVDILTVEKLGDKWQIAVAPDALEKSFNNPNPRELRILTMMSIFVGAPNGLKIFQVARLNALSQTSLSNVKQLGTVAMMYLQDYDEKFLTPAAKYKELLMPYIKNEKVFQAPAVASTEKVSYTFNKNLQGVALAIVTFPDLTVMLYEGKNAKPEYRYEGKTVIGFADGRAKLCTREEVAEFIWSEKEWKPEPVKAKPAPKKKPGKKR